MGSSMMATPPIFVAMSQRPPASRRRVTRRALHSPATVEAYLQAGMTPRFIERALDIEAHIQRHRRQLARRYELMRHQHEDDAHAFKHQWRALAQRWRFNDVNELIAEHNEWYPVEQRLPLDPRTRDYVKMGGRDWRRKPLDARWILEQFPA
jgi:hypothetical protein